MAWRAELDGWRRKRDATLKATAFPFSGYRVGQRALAVAAFRAHRDGAGLVCEAPTGLGKTAALVYPALQAIAHGHADRVLYLSARGTGQAAALDTLRSLRAQGAALRQVQIIAKQKVCLTPGAACAAETCPLPPSTITRSGTVWNDSSYSRSPSDVGAFIGAPAFG